MNLLKTCLLAVVLCCLTVSCSKDEGVDNQETNLEAALNLSKETDWEMANDVLFLINEHRATLNLSPILVDRNLATDHAVLHTQYMMAADEISHDNFGQRSQALIQNGAQSVGENVALGYLSAETVVNAWLQSESHRDVIEGNYTHAGFGFFKDERGTYYFTQLFYLQ